jgi:hypothetical protein
MKTKAAQKIELGPAEARIVLDALEKYGAMLLHDPYYGYLGKNVSEGIACDCEMLSARIIDAFGGDDPRREYRKLVRANG